LLEKLRAIAAIAIKADPTPGDIVAACGLVADALSASDVYVLRSGDPHFVRMGHEGDPTQYGVKQRGYWLLWQELARRPDVAAGIATVEDRLVRNTSPLMAGIRGNYIFMILPGNESNSEMLIISRGKDDPITDEEVTLVEIVRSIFSQLSDKVIDTDRKQRQSKQLSSLADVARAFNSAVDMDAALTDLATALAKASGFEWVTVLVYDETLEKVVQQGGNVARHGDTETAAVLRDPQRAQSEFQLYGPIPRRMRKGVPIVVPDVFAPGVLPERLQEYYARAHVNSFAWLPLMFQDRILGTVDFTSSIKRDFDGPELSYLQALADQAATAVKGMMLYRDLEQSRNEIMAYAEKLEEASRAEHFLARTDAVTGIPNRRYLEEVLRAESARSSRYQEPISVVMCDVDHFKHINDTYGHPVGDEALRFVSRVARECSRSSDFVGRWGGDEFMFILPQTHAQEAVTFADRFRLELREKEFRAEGCLNALSIPISAGIAGATPPPEADSEELVSRADQALYLAKQAGRDQVRQWLAAQAAA
jgi:diguanylate cyclase (GGDEF)-like protein